MLPGRIACRFASLVGTPVFIDWKLPNGGLRITSMDQMPAGDLGHSYLSYLGMKRPYTRQLPRDRLVARNRATDSGLPSRLRQSVEGGLHDRHSLLHHLFHPGRGLVREKIRDPDDSGAAVCIGEDLRRSVVMGQLAADR